MVHGRGLFFPDYVAASVPLSISQCTITSYGLRLKLIMRGVDIYPDLLKTECTPMTGRSSARSVHDLIAQTSYPGFYGGVIYGWRKRRGLP